MTATVAEKMKFRLDWKDVVDGVECRTLASISLLINGIPAWPILGEDTSNFDWYVDELLAHLTECWKSIALRQTYPIPIQPERPSLFRAEAEKRWSGLSDAVVEKEEQQVIAFEGVHNLASAFGGVTGLPPLWFFRDGNYMVIDTQERFWQLPFDVAIDALVAVGDAIAERLRLIRDDKWARLLGAWQQRDEGEGTFLLSLSVGLDRDITEALVREKILEPPRSVSDAANDNDELRIAVRVAGPLPINQIKSIIEKMRSCEQRPAPKLNDMATQASVFLRDRELEHSRPYVQGHAIAKWFRSLLKVSLDKPVDPISVLEKKCGIDVRAVHFKIPSLDGIAVWGPVYGPAVLLNQDSARVNTWFSFWRSGAVRVTAAHEMCHLLLDAAHTLSAVDVLGGRMPMRIEQRAKAFAAEFLLPSESAAAAWRDAGSPFDPAAVEGVLLNLCRRYGVTESVAAWQLEHGVGAYHQEQIGKILDEVAPQR